MRLQLDSETDRKLNDAIKAEPNILDQIQNTYNNTDHTIDSLITTLATKYRELTK